MRYTFNQRTDGNLNEAGNWTPDGGPPGAGDLAVFALGGISRDYLTGSLTVGGAVFAGYTLAGTEFTLQGSLSTTSLAGMLVDQTIVYDDGGSVTTNSLELRDGRFTVENGGTLQTNRVTIEGLQNSGANSSLVINGGSWTNTGNVNFVPPDGLIGSSFFGIDVLAGTAVIGGDINGGGTSGVQSQIFVTTASLTVGGSVHFAADGVIYAGEGGVIDIAGDLVLSANDFGPGPTNSVGVAGPNHPGMAAGTIDIGHDLVIGNHGGLSTPGGVLIAEDKIALLDGSASYAGGSGTIETPTIVLSAMAFLGTSAGIGNTPSLITGVDGGASIVFNSGTIIAEYGLTVNGDVRGNGQGTLEVGYRYGNLGSNVTVNGTLAGQDIQFGKTASSTLFADHFGANAVQFFAAGDIIASPGIQSIAYDPTSHTLSMDKGGGTVESLHMAGAFAGQQFTLSDNEYITLQPAPSQI